MFGNNTPPKPKSPAGRPPSGPSSGRTPTANPNRPPPPNGGGGSGSDLSVENTLKKVLEGQDDGKIISSAIDSEADSKFDAPLVQLVNAVLVEALKSNASDIHIEPFENHLRIRFRVDGVLQEVHKVPHKLAPAITSRLKIMADLDICEKRIPQDGCIKLKAAGLQADYRISTLPSQFGEKIVMRVMNSANVSNDLSKLGIPTRELKLIRDAIAKPDGLVLVTGPTGSGKTTTLYAALNDLNDISVSVFTAEDPIEGSIPGVTQCQVNSSIGYNFASILRSLLRQDPDVILVGEIRDQETAEISIKAALTGHLVLSTLHTNCSVSTISRLLNMGVADYLITSSVSVVVAQRLVRRVCLECVTEQEASPTLLERLGNAGSTLKGVTLKYGQGCKTCNSTGYKGRAPLYEVLTMSDNFRQMVLKGASREELKYIARLDGMVTLREAGIELIRQGITTIDEVLGATNEDSDVEAPVQVAVAGASSGDSDKPETQIVENQQVDLSNGTISTGESLVPQAVVDQIDPAAGPALSPAVAEEKGVN